MPPLETARSTSTASPSSTGGSGDGPALTAPWATSLARSVTVRWERTVLIRVPPMNRWIRSHVGPEPDDLTGPGRAEPELLPGQLHVPRRRHDPVELDRPTRPRLSRPADRVMIDVAVVVGVCLRTGGRGGRGGQGRGQPQIGSSSRCSLGNRA